MLGKFGMLMILTAIFLSGCGLMINDRMDAVLIAKEQQREMEAPGQLNIAHECRTAPLDVFKDRDGHTIIICAVPGGYGVINMDETKVYDAFSFQAGSLSEAKWLLSQ